MSDYEKFVKRMGSFDMDISESDDNLEHFGVLGMHWGVRKDKAKALTAPKTKNETNSKKDAAKVLKKEDAAWEKKKNLKKLTLELGNKVQEDPIFKKTMTKEAVKITKQYFNPVDQQNAWQPKFAELLNKKFINTPAAYNPSKTKVIQMYAIGELNQYGQLQVHLRNKVVDVSSLNHSAEEFSEDFLEHYGILGMKWGVRRDQAKSLRKAAKVGSPAAVAAYDQVKKSRKASAPDRAVKKDYAEANKNRRLLTDEELTTRINRLRLEQQLNQLTKSEISRGARIAEEVVTQASKETTKKALMDGSAYIIKKALMG